MTKQLRALIHTLSSLWFVTVLSRPVARRTIKYYSRFFQRHYHISSLLLGLHDNISSQDSDLLNSLCNVYWLKLRWTTNVFPLQSGSNLLSTNRLSFQGAKDKVSSVRSSDVLLWSSRRVDLVIVYNESYLDFSGFCVHRVDLAGRNIACILVLPGLSGLRWKTLVKLKITWFIEQ